MRNRRNQLQKIARKFSKVVKKELEPKNKQRLKPSTNLEGSPTGEEIKLALEGPLKRQERGFGNNREEIPTHL